MNYFTSPSVERVYFLTQDWVGAGDYSGQRQWGLLSAGTRDGWLDLGWVQDDSMVYDEHIFRAENVRTNDAGDVASCVVPASSASL
ncbi:MAG: hypothetical protein H0U66_05050 [Gemmatimonadaceae bacterium]|nr:hypothetical protein [Gemmatimonadaceae bacterium]